MYIPADATVVRLHNNGTTPDIGSWSSLIGIIAAICGNILISLALNTQRYAHMRLRYEREQSQEKNHSESTAETTNGIPRAGSAEDRSGKSVQSRDQHDDTERQPLIPKLGRRKSSSLTSDTYIDEEKEGDQASKSYLRSPIWWAGISMMVVGEAGNFLAYGFAPASIVSPLGVVALISNCLIAPLLLHEQFRARDGLGVIIAIGGCVTVVLSASGSNPKLDPNDIWHLITRWEFETYLVVTIVLMIVLMIASNRIGQRSVLIDLGLVALFGGYTALSTKGVASLLSNKVWRVFTYPITYLLIAVLISTAVLQIKYVNRALQRFNSTVVIPTQFVLFTISVIVGSAVLYRDFEKRSAGDAGKFIGGCALTFLGVWFITSGRTDTENDEEDSEQSKEDADSLQEETGAVNGSAQRMPRMQRSITNGETPELLISSPQTNDDARQNLEQVLQAGAGPAVRSSVHTDLATGTSSSSREQPPAVHATTSEPVVPTLKTTAPRPEPTTDSVPNAQRSSPSVVPQTAEPHPGARRLLSRQSFVDMLPGPLMSPLSSSLTAIVADSLRRGIDTPASSVRARTLRPHRRRTGESVRAELHAKRHSIDSADLNASDPASPKADPRKNRFRSLSTTIGDMFHSPSKRHQSQDEGDNAR